MSIASLAGPGFFSPLHGLWQRLVAGPSQPQRSAFRPPPSVRATADQSAPDNSSATTVQPHSGASVAATGPLRVLRVLRVVESGQGPARVGRMVISGRMADVCAELDRLAANEVTVH